MNVEILSTAIVYPSPPSFQPLPLPLSHLDTDRILHLPFRTLRLYAYDAADSFASVLPAALALYFPLALPLHPRPSDSRLQIDDAPLAGVSLTRAASSLTLSDLFAARPGAPLLNQFAPDPTAGKALARPLSIQLTALACGGFAVGMCVHHAICDGAGATQFLSTVAGLARGAGPPTVAPVWARAELLGPRIPPRMETPLFREVLGFDDNVTIHGIYDREAKTGSLVRECFPVSEERLNRFRNQLAEEASMSFTSFEVMSAYIWQTRIKASGIPSDAVVKLVYSMNIMKLLEPALPRGYWGNVCVPVYVHLVASELIEQPVWKTAKLIKESKNGVSDEYVRSYVDFQELHYADGITAGDRVSAFTDWRHLGHRDADFGRGGPVSVIPLTWTLLGSSEPCFFLPGDRGNETEKNAFKVAVSLPEKAMQALKQSMKMFAS